MGETAEGGRRRRVGPGRSLRGAQEAIDWGADVLIAQGMQAGGHNRGNMDGEPSLRQELVPRVRAMAPPEVSVLGAGGVADGRTLAAALREGAEAAWVGTIFAASEESYAHGSTSELPSDDPVGLDAALGRDWPWAEAYFAAGRPSRGEPSVRRLPSDGGGHPGF